MHLKSHTTANQSNRSGVLGIHTGSANQYFRNSNVVGDNFTTNFTGKVNRYLEAGAEIKVTSYLSSQWSYDYASININYSPKTNN